MIFLIASVVVLNAIALLVPKRLSRIEIWTTCLFSLVWDLLLDLYLDRKYHLYGYFTRGVVDWLSLIPILGLYPAASTIFLNFYPFEKSMIHKALYIVAWSVFSILFEVASLKSGYFHYNRWKLWYSALCYPVLLWVLALNLKFMHKLDVEMH